MKSILKSKIFWSQIAIIAVSAITYFTTEDANIKAGSVSAAVIALGAIVARLTSSKSVYIKKPKE